MSYLQNSRQIGSGDTEFDCSFASAIAVLDRREKHRLNSGASAARVSMSLGGD